MERTSFVAGSGLLATMRRHPALLVTVAYLSVSLIGMAFSWAFFRQFGIQYFLFADLSDFLLGAAREPFSLVAGAGGALVVWGLFAYSRWEYGRLDRRPDKGRFLQLYLRFTELQLRSTFFYALAIALYVFVAVTQYGNGRASAVREGKAAEVMLQPADGGPARRLLLMGSSTRFVFLYDPAAGATVVVPDESIAALTIPAPAIEPEPAPVPEQETDSGD